MVTRRVLLVDDNEKFCRILEPVLRTAGFDVKFVHEWKSALTLLNAERFDILVLDLMLPEIDGYEILRSLRHGKEFAALPVLVCSALGSEEDRKKARECGATEVLPKPFAPKELVRVLGRMIPDPAPGSGSPR